MFCKKYAEPDILWFNRWNSQSQCKTCHKWTTHGYNDPPQGLSNKEIMEGLAD